MKQAWAVFIFSFIILGNLKAQKNHFNISGGAGFSYFFNDKNFKRHLDNSQSLGLYYFMQGKKNICFNPGLKLQWNNYHAELLDYRLFTIRQFNLVADLQVLLKLAKRSFLKVGLWSNFLVGSDVSIVHTNRTIGGYYNYSNSFVSQGYKGRDVQTGFLLGVAIKVFKKEHLLGINFLQFGTGVVAENFFSPKGVAGQDITVLTTKARPSMLYLVFDYNLKKRKKPEVANQED